MSSFTLPFLSTRQDAQGFHVVAIGDQMEQGEDLEAVQEALLTDVRQLADLIGCDLVRNPAWFVMEGMKIRELNVLVPPKGDQPPYYNRVGVPDLLHPGTVGCIAAQLRHACGSYVCLPWFDQGVFRRFVVQDHLGDGCMVIGAHPIEGIALGQALLTQWADRCP